MRQIIFSSLALAAFSSTTFAANLPPTGPAAVALPESNYDWTGLYVGAHAGGLWGSVSVLDNAADDVPPGPFDYSVSGAFGGLTAGYNWQAGNFVLGAEGDIGYMGPNGSGTIGSAAAAAHQNLTLGSGWYGDLTGRAGVALDRTLIYAKGGAAFFSGSAKQQTTNPGYSPTGTGTFTGWTVGAGVEEAVTDRLNVKLEYQHFDFGTQQGRQTNISDASSLIGYQFKNWHTLGVDTVKVGLNYKF